MTASGGAGVADPIAVAHARLLADRSIQFVWSAPPRPPEPPAWLQKLLVAIGHAINWAAPALRIGLWAVLGLGVLLVLAILARQLRASPERRKPASPLNLQGLGPATALAARRAAVRLAEADELAARGRYAEAAHLLLLRGVADVESGRPGRIRPSLTSREIAALTDLPPEPRAAFAVIAGAVERALFGGRPLDAAVWRSCREAYEALVSPHAWAAPHPNTTP